MELYRNCLGSGMPVLLIHGVLSDSTFFSGAAQALSGSCRVISYDRSGYGESPDGADHSLAAQAEDAYRVLTGSADAPACIVGHSAGAHIALELALRHPQCVRQLVLIEPSLAFDPEDARLLAAWREELKGYAARNQLLRIFASFQKMTGAKRGEKPSAAQPQADAMARMRRNLRAFVSGDLQQLHVFTPPEAQLRALKMPVTVGVMKPDPANIFYRTALHDGAHFGWPVVPFPGTHSSIEAESEAFAKKLIEILQI